MSDKQNPIIIKKVKKASHEGHHGGSWKIAYADFVTAMMAFFLLMWLISSTSEEQKRGIANFFDPMSSEKSSGGSQGVMGGMTVKEKEGVQDEASSRITLKPTPPVEKGQGGGHAGESKTQEEDAANYAGLTEEEKKKIEAQAEAQKDIESKLVQTATYKNKAEEEKSFENISENIKSAIESAPELKELSQNINIEETKEGLRINIIDQNKQSMFPSGSSRMYKQMQDLLERVASAIKDAPNKIDIAGHTDAVPYSPTSMFTNWELSAERANATRRVLAQAAIPDSRFESVIGRADKELYDTSNPKSPNNRRISITLLREVK